MAAEHLKSPSSGVSDSVSLVASQRQARSATVGGMLLGLGGLVTFYMLAPIAAKAFSGGPELVRDIFAGIRWNT